MTDYYYIDPEVAGGLGEGTKMDSSVHPPDIETLQYEFDGWLGDDLLESFPSFIVTERLGDKLQRSGLSGFELAAVETTKSDTFQELHPDKSLPSFYWLQVAGDAGSDDFGLSDGHRLVISQDTLSVLEQLTIDTADIEAYP